MRVRPWRLNLQPDPSFIFAAAWHSRHGGRGCYSMGRSAKYKSLAHAACMALLRLLRAQHCENATHRQRKAAQPIVKSAACIEKGILVRTCPVLGGRRLTFAPLSGQHRLSALSVAKPKRARETEETQDSAWIGRAVMLTPAAVRGKRLP